MEGPFGVEPVALSGPGWRAEAQEMGKTRRESIQMRGL